MRLKTEIGIIVLAFNEVESLASTISEIQLSLGSRDFEIVISTSRNGTLDCQKTAEQLALKYPNVSCHFQVRPYVAAAVLEVAKELDSDFIIYMSADGETPAEAIPRMLEKQKSTNADIISASRWISGGSFSNYGGLKYLISLLAQQFCRVAYFSKLTEFTYGFRLYKSGILKNYEFLEQKHPFFLETLLVPIRAGHIIYEIPVQWQSRTEGDSVANIQTLISYLRPLIWTRIRKIPKVEL